MSACTGLNPNPDERSADNDLIYGNATRFVEISIRKSKEGYPWAQLRAGMA